MVGALRVGPAAYGKEGLVENPDADRLAVIPALGRLGIEPHDREMSIARLAGGLSGSSVWRLTVDSREMVLKLTGPESRAEARERAEREGSFYRELAGDVPIRVPDMIAQASSPDEGTALLLAAYPPVRPLHAWRLANYERVARDLGMLHGRYWGVAPTDLPDWVQAAPAISFDVAAEASARWAEVDVLDDLRSLRDVAGRLALDVPRLVRDEARSPLTLCHGDAHWGNLLDGESDGWIWTDWQGVRLGAGVDDLAFFWQRAFTVTDSVPPIERLLRAYTDGIAASGGISPSVDSLARAVAWSELSSWLIAWPPYLGWLDLEVRGRVLRRVEVLVDRLGLRIV